MAFNGIFLSKEHIPKALKIPSLINLAYTAPYMHDGRFKTLYEVIDHYDEHIEELHLHNPGVIDEKIVNRFEESDKKDMVDYLLSLKDTSIIKDREKSNPFNKANFNWKTFPNFK
ncbi:MAG: hypothetical protein M0D57_06435 [Sphingobacteriales bacterium JAD_PAG50586_3]|nr:MAG: hypothetical protein M0D57_06435 [Sphingobacteriales bacterium JAD_PAG50586_3]